MEPVNLSRALVQGLSSPVLDQKEIRVSVLRLDLIHPVISGNKWFKLKYWLAEAEKKGCPTLVSFGGPYSNHLVALAALGTLEGYSTIGLVRGVRLDTPTLLQAASLGMELHPLTVSEYADGMNGPATKGLLECLVNPMIIPEGGFGPPGVLGAEEILKTGCLDLPEYSHLFCAVGSGTMLAGLRNAALAHQSVAGVRVMPGGNHLLERIISLLDDPSMAEKMELIPSYDFGGFARCPATLLSFMVKFYHQQGIPTDRVYTAKLMFAILDLAGKNHFPSGSHILAIHSGGLQGNRSLPPGILPF